MGGLSFARESKAVQRSFLPSQETLHLHRPAPLETMIAPGQDDESGVIGSLKDGVIVGRSYRFMGPEQICRHRSSPRE